MPRRLTGVKDHLKSWPLIGRANFISTNGLSFALGSQPLSIFVFQGKIVAQGKLLLRGPLFCTDDPTSGPNFKMREMTVFLFEQVFSYSVHFITNGALRNQVKRLLQFWTLTTFNQQIMLFAETVGKKTQFTSPNYNYKAHIQV